MHLRRKDDLPNGGGGKSLAQLFNFNNVQVSHRQDPEKSHANKSRFKANISITNVVASRFTHQKFSIIEQSSKCQMKVPTNITRSSYQKRWRLYRRNETDWSGIDSSFQKAQKIEEIRHDVSLVLVQLLSTTRNSSNSKYSTKSIWGTSWLKWNRED